VEVVSGSVGLLRYWSSVYGSFQVDPGTVGRVPDRPAGFGSGIPSGPGAAQIVVRVGSGSATGWPRPGRVWIVADGVERPWDGREALFPPLDVAPLNRWLYLRGAAVGRAGQVTLLLSERGLRRTPIAVAAVARGAWLLADGLVPLDPDDLLVAPFPRALHLRRAALELLSIDSGHPALIPFRSLAGAIEWRAQPHLLLGPRLARVAADVGAIVVLEEGNDGPRLAPLAPGEALAQLAAHVLRAPTDTGTEALARLCRRVPAYTLVAGPPRATARLLDEMLLA
jgi:hypothetical protein